uniref:Uncharacterized protein n=1 Tax=Anthurium amnicola TaxID=1678845 RepID=A0A1D1ZAX7_9ARAE
MDGAGNPDLPPREPPETFATPGDKPAHRPPPPPARNPYPTWRPTLMNSVTLGFLAINAAFSIYRARSDPWILAFVVSAYAALLAFFCSVRAYEVAPPARKGQIKVVVFALAVLLILMFAYKVSCTMSFGFAVLTWLIAGVTTTFTFYGTFFMEGDDVKSGSGKSEGRKMAGNNQQL